MKRYAGYSLIELLIGILLFILLLLFIGTLIPMSQVSARSSSHHDVAMTLAESLMDNIRALPWDSIIKKDDAYDGREGTPTENALYPPYPYPTKDVYSIYPDPGTLQMVAHETKYYFTVQARYEPPGPHNQKLIKVVIGVSWDEFQGGGVRRKQITLVSKIARKQ